jgi:two-component system response regulator AtoC
VGGQPASATAQGAAAAGAPVQPEAAQSISLKEITKKAALEAEKEVIQRVLTQTNWNRKKAAKILNISYKALLYKIKESGLVNSYASAPTAPAGSAAKPPPTNGLTD